MILKFFDPKIIMYNPPVFLPPDFKSDVTTYATPQNLWHIPKTTFDPLWKIEDGEYATACVIDTGMNSHDLLPEPVKAETFIPGQSWRDPLSGHGTHCSGTILGRDGIGVAPKAKLMVAKALSNQGSGDSEGITKAIYWAVENGADVISMSLGSSSPYAPMGEAISYAWSKGVIVCCAAGNSGFNGSTNSIGWPARFLSSLCVGAYRQDGKRASFSSGGREMDVICPGQDIVSCSINNGFVSMSGTSMATPFFAGCCCLAVSRMKREGYIAYTATDVFRQFLALHCTDFGTPGDDMESGKGIPNSTLMVKTLSNDQIVWS